MLISINSVGLANMQAAYSATASVASNLNRGNQSHAPKPSSPDANVNISGTAQSKLDAEQQAANTTRSDALPIGIKHFLERLVDDPEYGAGYADGYVKNVHTACMTLDEAIKGRSTLEAGIRQLQASWPDIQSKGGSPAESFAMLLKQELAMPQSYWDAMDPGHNMPDIRAFAQAKLDYLEGYIASKKAV